MENRRRRQAIATVFTGDGFTVQPATEATGSYAVKPLPGLVGDGAPQAIKPKILLTGLWPDRRGVQLRRVVDLPPFDRGPFGQGGGPFGQPRPPVLPDDQTGLVAPQRHRRSADGDLHPDFGAEHGRRVGMTNGALPCFMAQKVPYGLDIDRHESYVLPFTGKHIDGKSIAN